MEDRIVHEFRTKLSSAIEEEKKRREALGEIRPIISTIFQGYRFVVCGSRLFYGKDWKTFPDFLMYYIRSVLGDEWGQSEIKKRDPEKHEIIKWYQETCRFQALQSKGANGLYSTEPSGAMAAYFNLAYDLFVLHDNLKLQEEVIRRLKHRDQFQGARYELFAAATCIRAGFEIEYEDETDRTQQHPEFKGVHKYTGQIIAVEAKSRHRRGVLGQAGLRIDDALKADIGRLLNKSLAKKPNLPFVIFIDLNLSEIKENDFSNILVPELQATVDRISKLNGAPPHSFNLLLFTNHPHHYAATHRADPSKLTSSVTPVHCKIPAEHPEAIKAIDNACDQYGRIPSLFKDSQISV